MRAWGRLDRASLREELRTNLWLVPLIEVVAALMLFALTYALDRAAFDGDFRIPSWALSGSPDASRQILTTVAAAIITVVGVVFSIVIVALTLASTQFGPRMLRNFIRDPGNSGHARHVRRDVRLRDPRARRDRSGEPRQLRAAHLDHGHAGAAGCRPRRADLLHPPHRHPDPAAAGDREHRRRPGQGDRDPGRQRRRHEGGAERDGDAGGAGRAGGAGGAVAAPRSGYLQSIDRRTLVRIAADADVVIQMLHRPGHFLVQGHPYATVWPAAKAEVVARELGRSHLTGPYRTLVQDVSFGLDQLVEIGLRALSPAVNDTFTAITCIDWIGDSLYKVTGNWQPRHVVPRRRAGKVRVITIEPTYERLVERSFEKLRQASAGMPAIMIRQLDALAKIMQRAETEADRAFLAEQAAMIDRLARSTVGEAADLADIQRAYQAVLEVRSGGQSIGAVTDRGLDASR